VEIKLCQPEVNEQLKEEILKTFL